MFRNFQGHYNAYWTKSIRFSKGVIHATALNFLKVSQVVLMWKADISNLKEIT